MRQKVTALLCAFLLFVGAIPSSAVAGGLGDVIMNPLEHLCSGLTYRQIHATDEAGAQIGYTYTLTPGQDASAIHIYGSRLYGRETPTAMLQRAVSHGTNILGGINGDIFALQTGIPLGTMVSSKMLISHDNSGRNALGTTTSGTILQGTPTYTISAAVSGGSTLNVAAYNKAPGEVSGLCLLSPAFATSTKSSGGRVEVILRASGNALLPTNGTVTTTVVSVSSSADTALPDGCFALSVTTDHSDAKTLSLLSPGKTVTLQVSATNGWESADFVTSTAEQILSGGKIVSKISVYRSARSAVAVTKDKKLVFFVCDGDGSYGKGINAQATATELIEMGCTEAFLLDSGSSSTAILKSGDSEQPSVVSHPQSGTERQIGGCILFINNNSSTQASKLRITPNNPTVLKSGGLLELSCEAVSASGTATSDPLSELTYSLSYALGTITGSTYRSGEQCGAVTLSAKATVNGKVLTGTTVITVVHALDNLSVTTPQVYVPVDGKVKLELFGHRSSQLVHLCGSSLKWSVSGAQTQVANGAVFRCNYGYVDNDLYFHANSGITAGSFTLIASYGYVSVPIQITIGKPDQILTSFNNPNESFPSYLKIYPTDTFQYTSGKFGSYGMRFSGNTLDYKTPVGLVGAKTLSLWIKGNCTSPYAVIYRNGKVQSTVSYQIDQDYTRYNGWKRYTLTLPVDTTALISPLASDTLMDCIVDEISVHYGTNTPVFSDIAASWAKEDINLIHALDLTNGYLVNGIRTYKPQNSLSRAEFAKMIVTYYGINLRDYANTELNFRDEKEIPAWAEPYVRAAVGSGLINGSSNPDGSINFLPNDSITRAQIVTIIARRLTAGGGTLSFADATDIPAYALSGVQSAVSIGLISGYPDGTFRPNHAVNRAETARILRRLYEHSYE